MKTQTTEIEQMALGLLASNAINARVETLRAWLDAILNDESYAEYLDGATSERILTHRAIDPRNQEFLYRLGAAIVDYRRRDRQAGDPVPSSVQGMAMSEFASQVLECIRYDANTAAIEIERLEDR